MLYVGGKDNFIEDHEKARDREREDNARKKRRT
jgi:hypothetical protein